jgi:hypothetical protein
MNHFTYSDVIRKQSNLLGEQAKQFLKDLSSAENFPYTANDHSLLKDYKTYFWNLKNSYKGRSSARGSQYDSNPAKHPYFTPVSVGNPLQTRDISSDTEETEWDEELSLIASVLSYHKVRSSHLYVHLW